jgi:hypothetical protein
MIRGGFCKGEMGVNSTPVRGGEPAKLVEGHWQDFLMVKTQNYSCASPPRHCVARSPSPVERGFNSTDL